MKTPFATISSADLTEVAGGLKPFMPGEKQRIFDKLGVTPGQVDDTARLLGLTHSDSYGYGARRAGEVLGRPFSW
jgi:hypothetical protein